MELQKNLNGSELVVTVKGRIDAATAPNFEKELTSSLGGVTDLILDFAAVDYVSSAGLRTLLVAQKRMSKQGSMVVKNVCEEVLEVFEMTGFSDFIKIEN